MAYLAYYIDHYSPMTAIQALYTTDSMPVNKNTLENIRESSQFANDLTSISGWVGPKRLSKKGSIFGTLDLLPRDLLTSRTSYYTHMTSIVLLTSHLKHRVCSNLVVRKHDLWDPTFFPRNWTSFSLFQHPLHPDLRPTPKLPRGKHHICMSFEHPLR